MHEFAYHLVEGFKLVAAVAGWLTIIDLIHFIFNRDRDDVWNEFWDTTVDSKSIWYMVKWAMVGVAGVTTGVINFLTAKMPDMMAFERVDLLYQLMIWGSLSTALILHWTSRTTRPTRILFAFFFLTIFSTIISGR